ncbi:MAG: DUF2029 domain-containing protein, partial [Pirellulaceae bacterium]|nr:DUF2029 domain-containing protein [Pirellulaceae bacterium]
MSFTAIVNCWRDVHPRVKDALGVLLFCLVLGVMLWRMSHKVLIPGEPKLSEARGTEGMGDYRDAVYYPIRAVLDGVNPYDCETKLPRSDGQPQYLQDPRYPVLNIFPLFSPLILLLFSPFGLIEDFTLSMWFYGTFNVVLLLVYAYVLWRAVGKQPTVGGVTALAAVILITQPGRANFIAGQVALPLTLAIFAALHWARNKPWLAGIALTLASFKPTFGVPLGLLMLCRKDFRAAGLGALLSSLIAAAGLLIIFSRSGDLANIVPILKQNQHELDAHPGVNPATSTARIDGLAATDRWLGNSNGTLLRIAVPLLVLSLAGLAVWKRTSERPDEGAIGPAGLIIILAALLSIYHLFYDALPLWIPILSLLAAPREIWRGYSVLVQRMLLALLAVPILNVLCTLSFKAALDRLVAPDLPSIANLVWAIGCTANGLSLSAAFLVAV